MHLVAGLGGEGGGLEGGGKEEAASGGEGAAGIEPEIWPKHSRTLAETQTGHLCQSGLG